MDSYDDYLTIGGSSLDKPLLGLSTAISIRIPFIALLSISKSSKIYWAKGFPLKIDHAIYGVQFSPDGVLLIAHSGFTPNDNFIVVLNVETGNVLSARVYTSGSIDIYNSNVKSI